MRTTRYDGAFHPLVSKEDASKAHPVRERQEEMIAPRDPADSAIDSSARARAIAIMRFPIILTMLLDI